MNSVKFCGDFFIFEFELIAARYFTRNIYKKFLCIYVQFSSTFIKLFLKRAMLLATITNAILYSFRSFIIRNELM